jgi:hypothetical protein
VIECGLGAGWSAVGEDVREGRVTKGAGVDECETETMRAGRACYENNWGWRCIWEIAGGRDYLFMLLKGSGVMFGAEGKLLWEEAPSFQVDSSPTLYKMICFYHEIEIPAS